VRNIIVDIEQPGTRILSGLADPEYLNAEKEASLAVFASRKVYEGYQVARFDRFEAVSAWSEWKEEQNNQSSQVAADEHIAAADEHIAMVMEDPHHVPSHIAALVKKSDMSISELGQRIRAETTQAQ
jgi:hypothetical protein